MNKLALLSSLLLTTACASDEATSMTEMPMPDLGVSSAPSARVIRDRAIDVAIEIVRNEDVVGPVMIEVDDLPAGVIALPLEIADGETTGTLKLLADDSIALGTKTKVTIRATAGETVAMTAMEVRLTDRPGSLDKTFANGGVVSAHFSTIHDELFQAVALQPDGKIVAAGRNTDFQVTLVQRFNPDGSIDKDFSDGGTYPGPIVSETIIGVSVRPDGNIMVVAYEDTTTNIRMLSSDGTPLATTVLSDIAARTMVEMPDGSLYLAGPRDSTKKAVVMKLDAALAPDAAFDGDGVAELDFSSTTAEPKSLLRLPDGRLALVGFADASGTPHYIAARLNADGTLDKSFSGDGLEKYSMLPSGGLVTANLLADGRIAAATLAPDEKVSMVYIETDGSIDMGKALPMGMYPHASLPVTDGLIVVGGVWSGTEWTVARFGTTGTLETKFGSDGFMTTHLPSGGIHVLLDAAQLDTDRAYAVGLHTAPNLPTEQSLIRIWL